MNGGLCVCSYYIILLFVIVSSARFGGACFCVQPINKGALLGIVFLRSTYKTSLINPNEMKTGYRFLNSIVLLSPSLITASFLNLTTAPSSVLKLFNVSLLNHTASVALSRVISQVPQA